MNALSPREFDVAAEVSFAAVQRSLAENANCQAVALPISTFLSEEECGKIRNRISRAQGQLAGIFRMLETRLPLPEVVIQMRAATKAVRRTAVRLLIVGYGIHGSRPSDDIRQVTLSHGFHILSSMGAGELREAKNLNYQLATAQHALNKAQSSLSDDSSYLEMIAALGVAGRAINETSLVLLLDRFAEAQRQGDHREREACEKLLMSYA